MKAVAATLVAVLVLLVPSWGSGQPAPQDPAAAATDGSGDDHDGVTPVDRGEVAPFDGVLLSDARFEAVADMRVELADAQVKLQVVQRLMQSMTDQLAAANAAREPGWLDRHAFVIGFVVGAAAAGLAVWGAVSVLETRTE